MTNRSKFTIAVAAAFLAGLLFPALAIWNPAGWAWPDYILGRAHITHEVDSAGSQGHDMAAMDDSGAVETAPLSERKILYWRAPMDPNYISDKPGKSPMGMDLIPVYEDEAGGSGSPSGVRVDPSFLQNFAVRTAVVERGTIPIEIRTVGILQHNATNVVSINTKFEGWIEKSNYNTVGEYIEKGVLLFEI
jgi:hypothetical protein